jgi:hypothetical protein
MQVALMLLQASSDVPSWATLGVGGALAGMMFYFYRADRKANEERNLQDRKANEERLRCVIEDYRRDRAESEERFRETIRDFRGAIEANTRAMLTNTKAILERDR